MRDVEKIREAIFVRDIPGSNSGGVDWRGLVTSLCFTMGISLDLQLHASLYSNWLVFLSFFQDDISQRSLLCHYGKKFLLDFKDEFLLPLIVIWSH